MPTSARFLLLMNAALMLAAFAMGAPATAAEIFVRPNGLDSNPGTKARPVRTIAAAQKLARQAKSAGPVNVWLRGGTYYLPATLVFTPDDSGSKRAPITYAGAPGEEAIVSGGARLELEWKPFRNGIMVAQVPKDLNTDQLFINGERQVLARYPNFNPQAQYYDGWSADAFSKERAAKWNDPRGGFIHAMHRHMWGDFHYVITGKDAEGNVTYEGGWQNNRRLGMHDRYRFVENLFEELDAAGEWFLDRSASRLYYYPPEGLELSTAVVEVVRLRHLVEFRGSEKNPVSWITLRNLTFRHAARTFMDNREPLQRSDWTTYRGGAVFLTGTENCTLEECVIDRVGGNAVFVNHYNRHAVIRRCHIYGAGANGVAFVGDPQAARSSLSEYAQRQRLTDIDRTPGPRTNNHPADCLVEDSLLHRTGRVEKQSAPVQFSMARNITVRHCSIYDVPRAGINICDGTWGGHVIEYCDVFDTVKETGDHGSFNSWGRDRYWELTNIDKNALGSGDYRELPRLDAVDPVIIRNSRWRCDHGWDIDLDDGSTNYRIYNNLTLNCGIKLREGFHRTVENNVMVNNSFHPHVWYPNSQDVFRRNIVFGPYRPVNVRTPWGAECDQNLLYTPGLAKISPAAKLHEQSGRDEQSIAADAMFINPALGDYRVREGSPALRLGFQNFAMDNFGVQWPKLKALARTPELPRVGENSSTLQSGRDAKPAVWLGATVRNVVGMGEVSAAGLPGETGVLVLDVPPQSRAAAAGLRERDVVIKLAGKPAESLRALLHLSAETPAFGTVELTVFRAQREVVLQTESPVK